MQEPFIDGHVQRTTRNLLLLSVGAIAVCLGLLGLSGRYLYNFFAGPFPTDTAALLAVSDPEQPLRRFVSVKGEGMMPTGLQQITVTKSKYTGAERSRRVSAAYGALLVGKRLLLVKAPGELKGNDWTGELVAVPADVRSRVMTTPKIEALFLPYMLDAGSYRTGGYVGLSCAALVLLLAGWGLRNALRRKMDPGQHPLMQRLKVMAGGGDPRTVAAQIDAEVTQTAAQPTVFGGVRVTPGFVILPSMLGVEVLRLADLVWAHGEVTQHRTNGIPTGKTFAVKLHDRGRTQITLACKKEQVSKDLLAELARRAPHALFGYSDDLQKLWLTSANDIIAAVDKRKQGG